MKYNDLYEITALPDHPVQPHEEYELTLFLNVRGHMLTVGDHAAILEGDALLLTAPDLPHGLDKGECGNEKTEGIAVRISDDLLGDKFLGKSQLVQIRGLLEQARYGIGFSPEMAGRIGPRIRRLEENTGFGSFLELLSILHELSITPGRCSLSTRAYTRQALSPELHRIESAFAYMKANFSRPISLADVAGSARMTRGAFCRFIRKRTGKTYVESMNEIRIGHICRMLVETSENVSEIAYKAGYNNINYFHRWFKRQEGCTPKEFRERRLNNARGI